MNDQMCDQLSFKEYEDPFKNVADFDEDDSPEIPTDSLRNDVNGQLVGSGLDRSVCSRRHSVSEGVWDADPCAYRAIKIVYFTKRGDAHAA